MSLFADTIQAISSTIEDKPNENNKLTELIKKLEKPFNSSNSSIPQQEMVEQLGQIIMKRKLILTLS